MKVMNILKKTLLLFLLLLFLLVGFYRVTFTNYIAFFFTNLFDNPQFTQAHVSFSNIFTIFISWIDTLIYSIIHSILIISILHLYFKNKQLNTWVTVFIIGLLFSATLFIILYKITKFSLLYTISEDFIYATLSPIPLLFGLFLGYLLPLKDKLKQK